MQDESICQIVREAEDNYLHGTTQLGQYVDWSMHDNIEKIDAYLNSRHTSGPTDALNREKPFFNIVTAATNIWYRATDLDRKNIRILPDKSSNTALAFVATVHLQNWMKDSRFGVFLNEWGRSLARYGSSVVKFVEANGELTATVIPWNRMITDPVDFDATPRVEKFYKTPAQLTNMATVGHPDYAGYDPEMVKGLIAAKATRKTLEGQNKDQLANFIELYEVHGLLSVAVYKDAKGIKVLEGDETTYKQQMHVVSFAEAKAGDYDDYTLYCGYEKKDPYMITHLIKEDGRTLAIGAVEYLFDSQWMVNHSMKNMKDTLDITSKLILQSADPAFVGRNVLSAIESGDILTHKDNQPLTRLANDKPDITALQNFGTAWMNNAQSLTSTPDALAGNTLPSGTPYSLGAYLGGQASSLFEIMTENKGLHIEDMMREYILPFLMKKMNTSEEIVAVLDDEGIAEIDAMYVPKEAARRYNQKVKEDLLKGSVPSPYQADVEEANVRKDLAPLGNKRFFKPSEVEDKTWKKALENFEARAVVEVTNENTDKQAVLTTLSSLLQSIAANPAILQDPNAKMLFSAIIRETGVISPIQLSTSTAAPVPTVSPPGGAKALEEIAK